MLSIVLIFTPTAQDSKRVLESPSRENQIKYVLADKYGHI